MVINVERKVVSSGCGDPKGVFAAGSALSEEAAWLCDGPHLIGLTMKLYPGMDGMQALSRIATLGRN